MSASSLACDLGKVVRDHFPSQQHFGRRGTQLIDGAALVLHQELIVSSIADLNLDMPSWYALARYWMHCSRPGPSPQQRASSQRHDVNIVLL
jgi:transposase